MTLRIESCLALKTESATNREDQKRANRAQKVHQFWLHAQYSGDDVAGQVTTETRIKNRLTLTFRKNSTDAED